MNENAEQIIRKEAAYFIKGDWPKVMQDTRVSPDLIKTQKAILAIIPVEDTETELESVIKDILAVNINSEQSAFKMREIAEKALKGS